MRVIAGTARGRPLKGPRGAGTRPTSDKVKGAIFSMLESLLTCVESLPAEGTAPERPGRPPEAGAARPGEGVWSGLRVLDLYAGTGALGIEALSRGAAWADFVDVSSTCARLTRENLRVTGLADRARVVCASVAQALGHPRGFGLEVPYDVVLLDAPYGDPTLEPSLEILARSGLLAADALVVVEHSRRFTPADAYDGLHLIRRRRHGDTEVSIYLRE